MPVYFEYALKVSISLAVVFLFYTLLLKRMTYYKWNRYFLLMFSLVSFIVPFINVNVFVQAQEKSPVSFVNEFPSIYSVEVIAETNNPGMIVYWQILSAVFLLVSFALVIRLLIQFFSIQKIKSKSTLLSVGEENIFHFPQQIVPFSFLNDIFINTNNYNDKELLDILNHERVHVQEKHSVDMLVSELVCILNWYNPFAWMLKKAVRENLEFIADDRVVSKGIDKKGYQYLMLKVTGNFPSPIASSFKLSSLKARMIMMNRSKTSQLHLLKFVLLVPMIVILLLAFRNSKEAGSEVKRKSETTETYTLYTLTYSIPDEKVKAIVVKEKGKSLLKPGELLNLTLIHNEKDRLKSLLEKNGYRNIRSNAIRFMIDSASVNNSFSIEVKIDLEQGVAAIGRKRFIPLNKAVIEVNLRGLSWLHAGQVKHKNDGQFENGSCSSAFSFDT